MNLTILFHNIVSCKFLDYPEINEKKSFVE